MIMVVMDGGNAIRFATVQHPHTQLDGRRLAHLFGRLLWGVTRLQARSWGVAAQGLSFCCGAVQDPLGNNVSLFRCCLLALPVHFYLFNEKEEI